VLSASKSLPYSSGQPVYSNTNAKVCQGIFENFLTFFIIFLTVRKYCVLKGKNAHQSGRAPYQKR
jgi:hypothetical protein